MTLPLMLWDETDLTASAGGTVPSNTNFGGALLSLLTDGNVANQCYLFILKQYGAGSTAAGSSPVYADNSAAGGFNKDTEKIPGANGNGRGVIFSKVLTSSDFVGGVVSGGFRRWTASTTGWGSAPSHCYVTCEVWYHADGFDTVAANRLVGQIASADTNSNVANGTAIKIFDTSRGDNSSTAMRDGFATTTAGWFTVSSPLITMSGQSQRSPYNDGSGSPANNPYGGHASTGPFSMSFTNTSTNVLCSVADVKWVGLVLGAGAAAGSVITAVVPNTSFTISAAAVATATQNVSLNQPHYGTNDTGTQIGRSDYQEYASGTTSITVAWSAGCANSTHAFVGAAYQARAPIVHGTQAAEHDHPQAGTVLLTKVGTQAHEIDTARIGFVPGGPIPGHTALEHDTPQAGTVSQGYLIVGNQAHEIDTARPGGFFIGTWTERVAGPQSAHFRVKTLTMRVFKKNVADVGDVRFSFLQGTTHIAGPTPWTALTNTPTDVVLDVSAAAVSDPSNLWIEYSFRRLQNDSLEPAISWIALDWESWAVEADHPQAGKVLVTVVGHQATERDHPVAGIIPTIIVGNQAHEIDHPQAPAVRGVQAVEIDRPQAGVVLVNLPRKSEKRVFPPKSRFEVVQWM